MQLVYNVYYAGYQVSFYLWRIKLSQEQKKMFLEISQNLQENSCARVSFLIKLQASDCNFTNFSWNFF